MSCTTPTSSSRVRSADEAAVRGGDRRHAGTDRSSAPAGAWRSTRRSGRPDEVAERFGLDGMAGTHAIGHTRMATEVGRDDRRRASLLDRARPVPGAQRLAVQPQRAAPRADQRDGMTFETENDTEVAAGYLTWRMRQGDSSARRSNAALDDLDGFYTFVVGTEDRLRRAARSDRLQAGGDGRDRRLCRLRLRISRARRTCPASRRPGSGSRSRPPSISGSVH